MKYLSVSQIAKEWNLSERSVRNYCALGKIEGAVLEGKTWRLPIDCQKPKRKNKAKENVLLEVLKREKCKKTAGGIYHKIQIELTYNSNHIEGSKLSHDQTRYIFETNTIGVCNEAISVDDIIEASNHFRGIDLIIEKAENKLSESFIKEIHKTLKQGTTDSNKSWFNVGEYKKLPNEVGGKETTLPEDVQREIKELLNNYNKIEKINFTDILDFHVKFEKIHPFQDGNGRVGRLIMFKECLKAGIVPFIINDEIKYYYYRGLSEWNNEKGFLKDTCLLAQDNFKKYLDYFRIEY